MVNGSCLRGHHCPRPFFFLKMEGDISFVTANHYRLEHKQGEQCQVQAERTKYPRCREKREETRLTYENNCSWTDKQQNPDAERNTSDGNRLLPCEDWSRRKQNCIHSAPLFSAHFCQLSEGKTWYSLTPQQLLVSLATHFATKEIRSPCKDVFSSVCVCVYAGTQILTMAFASAGISRFGRMLGGLELMKNMSDKIHGSQSSWWKWRGERRLKKNQQNQQNLWLYFCKGNEHTSHNPWFCPHFSECVFFFKHQPKYTKIHEMCVTKFR